MTDFDPGYCAPPFYALCRDLPGSDVYPSADFRVEWGPVFHRGRLDGSARVLVIGQDPAQHEEMARRILIGTAGHRTQGFLAKLGIDRSYVMVNTFLYSLYGQGGGDRHQADPAIIAYRNRWLDALLQGSNVEAVVALGALADGAWQAWKSATTSHQAALPYQHITHPTQPESSTAADPTKLPAAIAAMLGNWNAALQALQGAVKNPDTSRPLQLYGSAFAPGDLVSIPAADLPAGSPAWMLGQEAWADRTGATAQDKRYTITISVPPDFRS
ncbi:MAG: uracil-DNA glycosylase [Candidatus Dormibacteraeota bacterium]|nr:uracil-DNA glycosylase [Candidatus Dormibacteraeota bacterium]